MTNDVEHRVNEHKHGLTPGFTTRYNVNRLVHLEEFSDVYEAMDREEQIKSWRRSKKIDLIEESNPGWHDLSAGWYLAE